MSQESGPNPVMEEKIKEATILRGICASIQAMTLPNMKGLNELLLKFGYKIVKL